MVQEMLGSMPGAIVSGYESLVQSFGSPVVLLAISVTLIALAAVELCVRRRKECKAGVR